MLRKQFQRSLLLHVIIYLSPKCLKSVGKMQKTDFFPPKPGFRQSWTKVLRTVPQYSYFSVISRFPLNSGSFPKFSCSSPSPTLYKVEYRRKFWIHSSNIVCGVRGGLDLCALKNAPETRKCSKTFVHYCRYNKFSALSVTNILGIRSLGTGSYMYHYD